MEKKIIGILGGIGPESTGYFYLDLIKKFSNRFHIKSNKNYPHLIINSIPAKELIFKANKEVLKEYIVGLKVLEQNKVYFIAIICNTAYLYLKNFKKDIKTPIIDLRKEVENYLRLRAIKSITVFASKETINNKLYRYNGIKNIDLTKKEIDDLNKAIEKFNLGKDKNKQIEVVKNIYKKYKFKSDIIISGCSEISLILKKEKNVLDTMDLMIEAIIREYNDYFFTKKKSYIHRLGIFTKRELKKGDIIYKIPLFNIINKPHYRFARIGKDKYVSDEILNYVNHSCDSNAKLILSNNGPFLMAVRNIRIGEEITCDYNLTEIGGIKVNCSCKSTKCRGYFKRIE